jgi:hypothetical protein
MRIELATGVAADALAEYLRRCECIVSFVDECTLEASTRPRSQNYEAAELELVAYLRVWRMLNPGLLVSVPRSLAVD